MPGEAASGGGALSTTGTWASMPALHRTTTSERRLPPAATLAQEEERLLLGAKGYGREEMFGERNDGGVGGCCRGDSIRAWAAASRVSATTSLATEKRRKLAFLEGTAMTALNPVLAGLCTSAKCTNMINCSPRAQGSPQPPSQTHPRCSTVC